MVRLHVRPTRSRSRSARGSQHDAGAPHASPFQSDGRRSSGKFVPISIPARTTLVSPPSPVARTFVRASHLASHFPDALIHRTPSSLIDVFPLPAWISSGSLPMRAVGRAGSQVPDRARVRHLDGVHFSQRNPSFAEPGILRRLIFGGGFQFLVRSCVYASGQS